MGRPGIVAAGFGRIERFSFPGVMLLIGEIRMVVPRALLAVLALAFVSVVLPADRARAAGWQVVQAESMTPSASKGTSIARGRYALGMRRGAAYLALTTLRETNGIVVRARGRACGDAPVLAVVVDGRTVLQSALAPGGWQRLDGPLRLAAGDHHVAVALRNPGATPRCAGTVRVDRLALRQPVPMTTAATSTRLAHDDRYTRALLENFGGFTPENEMKWQFLEPSPGRFEFASPDELADFAGAHGLSLHGHALVFDKQLPQWLTSPRPWRGAQLLGTLSGFVQSVVARYRGRVSSWDVVNEPLRNDGRLGANVFSRMLGEGYIAEAFRAARAADPAAKLYVNEIGADGISRKSDALYALVRRLRAQRVPIDGVGFQFHSNLGPQAPTAGEVRANFQRFADLGVEIAVSEMDVRISDGHGDLAQRLAAQADTYRMVARVCAEQPACVRFTTWGFTDASTWLGLAEHPLPFYEDYVPKPAWAALTSELR